MKIVNYEEKFEEGVKDLFVELQDYIVTLDREKLNVRTEEFRDKYFSLTMENILKYEGEIFVALDGDKVVGVVVGLINNDEVSECDFKAPRRGRIVDLVVRSEYQGRGIGQELIKTIEDYFRSVGCRGVLLDVFAYNERAYKFYEKLGYFNRTIQMMKNI